MASKLITQRPASKTYQEKNELIYKLKKKIDYLREKYDEYDSNHPYRQSIVTQRIGMLQWELIQISGEDY